MAKPTVAIRVPSELYDDLVKIADDRDVTITQALDIYIRRQRRPKGVRPRTDRDRTDGDKGGAKTVARPKAKRELYTGREKPTIRRIKLVPKPGT